MIGQARRQIRSKSRHPQSDLGQLHPTHERRKRLDGRCHAWHRIAVQLGPRPLHKQRQSVVQLLGPAVTAFGGESTEDPTQDPPST